MISFVDKGCKRPILILSGWGFDPLIFRLDALDFDLLLPKRPLFDPLLQIRKLLRQMCIKRINVLGWSLGARIARDMAESEPELFDKVFLVSMCPFFPKKIIDNKMEELKRDRERALKGFYFTLFHGDRLAYKQFKRHHEKRCMAFWSTIELEQGLRYLEKDCSAMPLIKNVLVIHGANDPICPVEEAVDILPQKGQKKLILPCGHLPFLEKGFYEAVNSF